MYKVLIVDDEVLVRIGLKNTIDWESIGFTVVGEASNGEQGYAQFLKLSPDVVITDIKMPKQDGLWLTDKIHRDSKRTKILVLTCYDEFQYARTALKNGATDYMLKSEIVDDELIALMKKFREALDEEGGNATLSSTPEINLSAIKRSLLNDLIKMRFQFDEKLSKRFEDQHFKNVDTKYAFLTLEVKRAEAANSKTISETIMGLVVDLFNERGISYLLNGYTEEHLFLISHPDLSLTLMHRIATTIQNGVNQYFGIAVNILYTNAFPALNDLYSQYERLMARTDIFFYIPKNESLVENVEHIKVTPVKTGALKSLYTSKLVPLVGREDLTGATTLMDEIIGLHQSEHHSPQLLKLLMTQLISDLHSAYDFAFSSPEFSFSFSSFHDAITRTTHVDGLRDLIVPLLTELIRTLGAIRIHQSKHLVHRAINYVDHHYHEDISLDDVAKELNLSKQYVCSLFKKDTGQNLSTYINQVRIDHAKVLLQNPTNSHKEIYAQVGFSNQQYFTRVFKKITGMTTTEWLRENSTKSS